MRRRFVLGMKGTRNRAAQRPREKGPLARGRECANPSRSRGSLLPVFRPPPSLWVVSVIIYSSLPFILLLHLSVIHTYPQVYVPSAILSGALWAAVAPIALSRGHIHIKGGQGVSCVYLIRRWQLFLGLPPHHSPMASPYGLEPLLRSSSGCPRVTWRFFFPMILACRGRHSGNLDSLHSSLGTFSSSAWALGLRWNGPKPLGPSGPTDTIYKTIYVVY